MASNWLLSRRQQSWTAHIRIEVSSSKFQSFSSTRRKGPPEMSSYFISIQNSLCGQDTLKMSISPIIEWEESVLSSPSTRKPWKRFIISVWRYESVFYHYRAPSLELFIGLWRGLNRTVRLTNFYHGKENTNHWVATVDWDLRWALGYEMFLVSVGRSIK